MFTDIYSVAKLPELLDGNRYPGRGIVTGMTPDGKKAVSAYFIMGRSKNSRNRVFTEKNGELFTEPFDPSLVEDPSLIIYAAVRKFGGSLIVTNGNQTDTVYEGLAAGKSFSEALESREFEPDSPNWTPRISAVQELEGKYRYQMSILKSLDPEGSECSRYTFSYVGKPGLGHFIHTYVTDGNPIPTFFGEPERIETGDCIECFTKSLWNALDPENKISLWVRYTDLETGEYTEKIINKNN